ncbi:MAG TPA: PEP-CTERM sorting domain-containing protein [Bryobacteraceae bacterium]
MRFTKLVSLWALAAAPMVLATPCTTGTLASYIALGSTGCMDGIFNVEDFTFDVISTAIPITADDITVAPSTTSDNFSLQFSSSLFDLSGTNSIDVQIGYLWDPADIGSIREAMGDPPVFPGESSVTIDACENANFVANVCPTTLETALLFDNQQVRILNATIIFPPGVTSLGMEDTVYLAGNGTGSADITNFSDTVVTPEPATFVLVPVGVGVLFAWRRRTHAHSGQALL